MANSTLDIWNLALSAAQAKGRLSSPTDASVEREECETWYDTVIGVVQEAAHWEGSRAFQRLTLLSTRDFGVAWSSGDPAPEFQYAYALPTNYLRARHLTDYTRFSIDYDASRNRRVLSSNTELAVLVYNRLQTDVTRWSEGQKMATAYGLAAKISGPLSRKSNLVAQNTQLANRHLEDAQGSIDNSDSYMVESIPPWIAARGYADLAPETRFIYPLGSVFSAAVVNV